MPLHWIYDRDKIKTLVTDRPDRPEFFDPPSCPFYTYEQGRNSPYGRCTSLPHVAYCCRCSSCPI